MAMINATDLKSGASFLYEGKPFKVVKYELTKMGRGGAVVRVSCFNLETGSNVEHAFSSNLSFQEVDLSKQKLQYLYKDATTAFFINPRTYDQIEIPLGILGKDIAFVKEGEETTVQFWGDKALSVELPPKIVLAVSQTDPGVKGNSATNIYKPAVLENGLKIKVPLFVNTGDKIRVDTRTGEYIERAKE
jgi:elongation factor P